MVNGVASFCAADGGGDISACGGDTAAVMRGIASRGVALGRSMVVLCWLGGWGGGRGGGRCGRSAMVDVFFGCFSMYEVWGFLILAERQK